jgi:pyrroline-5-carboxylate reductase
MTDLKYKLGVIGAGNMACAMLQGAFDQGILEPKDVLASRRHPERRDLLRQTLGLDVTADNHTLIQQSRMVMLALKPQQASRFFMEHGSAFVKGQILFSVLAGITVDTIRSAITKGVTVIRTMPNTPALVGKGVTLVTGDPLPTPLYSFLKASGSVVPVAEAQFDHATAISGCGPAYVFLLAESLAGAGRHLGLEEKLAERLANDTLFGAAALLEHSWPDIDAEQLRHKVTSPGGATAAAIAVMENQNIRTMMEAATKAAQARAEALGK